MTGTAGPSHRRVVDYSLGHAVGGELGLRTRVPAPGLRDLARSDCRLSGPLLALCSWLAQGVDPRPAPPAGGRFDVWQQGTQIVAIYEEGPANPLRFELRWRPLLELQGIELELSCTTSLVPGLFGFEVFTCSRVPRGEVLVALATGEGVTWVDLDQWCAQRGGQWAMACRDESVRELVRDGRWPAAARAAQVGFLAYPAVLYRPPGSSWSYAEVGRKSEVTRLVFRSRRARDRWGFGLFGQHMEKGVILRTSLCCVLLDRSNDMVELARLAATWQERLPSLRA